jgi:hypothetical protein
LQFTELRAVLQAAKDKASESESCTELVSVCGHEVSVDASGARASLLYRFKFTFGGITFFVPVHGILSYLPAFIGTKLGGDSP